MMTGKNAKNRRKVAVWANRMEKDVLAELKKVKKGSQAAYNKAVDTVAKNYKAAKKVSAPELAVVAADLKGHWNVIRQELEGASKIVRRIKPKAAKSKSRQKKIIPYKKESTLETRVLFD
jgi:uncharacterized protein with gpF-like domain